MKKPPGRTPKEPQNFLKYCGERQKKAKSDQEKKLHETKAVGLSNPEKKENSHI
jgi:hypothetical protein